MMEEIEKTRPGVIVTFETRAESNEKVDRKVRYNQIIEILRDSTRPMSAKEIAIEMKERGYSTISERNLSAPRLTELSQKGIVEPCGKGYCKYSDMKVTFYKLREGK